MALHDKEADKKRAAKKKVTARKATGSALSAAEKKKLTTDALRKSTGSAPSKKEIKEFSKSITGKLGKKRGSKNIKVAKK